MFAFVLTSYNWKIRIDNKNMTEQIKLIWNLIFHATTLYAHIKIFQYHDGYYFFVFEPRKNTFFDHDQISIDG